MSNALEVSGIGLAILSVVFHDITFDIEEAVAFYSYY